MTELIAPAIKPETKAAAIVTPTGRVSLTPAEVNDRVARLARLSSLEYKDCRLMKPRHWASRGSTC